MTDLEESLAVEIVHTLEAHGLACDEYRLADAFDPDALERLVRSADPVAVRLEVHGIGLIVTDEEIRVLEETDTESGEQAGGDSPEPMPCPRCGTAVTAVIQLVPTKHHTYPCGCVVQSDLLE